MKAKFILGLSVLSIFLFAPDVARAQWVSFTDVPANHWAYQSVQSLGNAGIMEGYPDRSFLNDYMPSDNWEYRAIDTMQKAGIVIAYPDGVSGRPFLSRDTFAIAITRLVPVIDPSVGRDLYMRSQLMQEMRPRLEKSPPARAALKALVLEFTPELKEMGQNPKRIEALLDAMGQAR